MPSKKSRLRLYADENIPIPSITYLKDKGISIKHAYDFNYIGMPDKKHLQKSKGLDCVLISLDKDMKKFKGVKIDKHPGVILIKTSDITSPHLNKLLDKVLKNVTPAFAKDSLIRFGENTLTRERAEKIIKRKVK